MKQKHKTEFVAIRFTPEQLKEIERRANARGMNLSEHVRDLVMRDIEESKSAAA